jgi:Ca-activated chloride channel family protein
MTRVVLDRGVPVDQASDDFRFSAALAAFGMLLRESPYSGTASYESIRALAAASIGPDFEGERRELLALVDRAARLQSAHH